MGKKRGIQVLGFWSLICMISICSIVTGYDFSITSFWEKDGKITFEEYSDVDYPGTISDFDYTDNGFYTHNESLTTGNLAFNYTTTSSAQELVYL